MRERYGGGRLALGGGVFMNVKANMLIGQEEWVEELFAFPSCGDESNAVGAAYLGYLQECARRGVRRGPAGLRPRLPGPVGDRRGGRAGHPRARARGAVQGRLPRSHRGAHRRAAGLRRGGRPAAPAAWSSAPARSATGRSWPTRRTTGGRSINRMIKNRDFWMPFAPTVLAERAGDYLVNPKGLASPYMMLAMPTRPEAAGGAGGRGPSPGRDGAPADPRAGVEPGVPRGHPRVRAADRRGRGAEHLVQPPRRADRRQRRPTRSTRSSAPACRTSRSGTGSCRRSNAGPRAG